MSPSAPPVFARVAMGGRVEFAIIPGLGGAGRSAVGGWTPFLLVDRRAAINEHLTAVIIEDTKWAGLLGFLASREIAAGTKLLDSGLSQSAVAAMADKVSNPLAAVAGALIAVAASNPDIEKVWDPWLENIANWFMDVPDGPIVLGRRLLMRARTEAQVAEARRWFVEGFRRRVPFYSLSVDWLSRGLESIPGDDEVRAETGCCFAQPLSRRVRVRRGVILRAQIWVPIVNAQLLLLRWINPRGGRLGKCWRSQKRGKGHDSENHFH